MRSAATYGGAHNTERRKTVMSFGGSCGAT